MSDKVHAPESSTSANLSSESKLVDGSSAGDSKKTTGHEMAHLKSSRAGIFGRKAGMTQVYEKDGSIVPATVIDIRDNVITQVKTLANEGYSAVQLGIEPKKPVRCSRAEKGHFKKSGSPGYLNVVELRVDAADSLKEGMVLSLDSFKEGDLIDIAGVSKGKGFQGVMKRYNFSGGPKSHGASVSHRSPGSIGNRADPGRVFPGKKMAGQMGSAQVTMQNLRILRVDAANGLIVVKGSVPGPKQGFLRLLKASKQGI